MLINEREWLETTASEILQDLQQRRQSLSPRKLRLFAVACARSIREALPQELVILDYAERIADGRDMPGGIYSDGCFPGIVLAAGPNPLEAAAIWANQEVVEGSYLRSCLFRDIFGNPFRPVVLPGGPLVPCPECRLPGRYCRLCHGTARTPSPCPWLTWNDNAVVRLAQAIYDERAFSQDRLNILVDVLVEAGCDNADIISHLRGPGPDHDPTPWEHRERANNDLATLEHEMRQRLQGPVHVRGCWAIDLLIRRE